MQLFFRVCKKKRQRGRHTFKRLRPHHHFREFIWPSMGMPSFLRFVEIKMKRAKGSARNIALGFAFGVFASFTPYVGLHSLIALGLSWLFHASLLTALLGTLVGNPWTFPIIWLTTHRLGSTMLGREPAQRLPESFTFGDIFANFSHYFTAYLWPMTLAGVPLGLLAGTVVYVFVSQNLKLYRKARVAYLNKRRTSFLQRKKDMLKQRLSKTLQKDNTRK